ncbi:MAG: imidazole glycerol phosphate synthase subunit HisF [Deltaproteobacteria bacterium]|nr:imidazole glycerol phosphate synthase subunit HisF [Deltaproteobacteria bacterium]
MLKRRLIPVLFLKEGFLVRSEKFTIHQNLGNPVAQVKRYNLWDVDELIYIDISREEHYDRKREDQGLENPNNIYDIIKMVSKECFMPLTFGGRIRTLDDIRKRLELGADKVTINTHALNEPEFINKAASVFGSQCIIVSMDVLRMDDAVNGSHYQVCKDFGKVAVDKTPLDWALEAQERGAGEIFLNSIDRDGMACGYDVEIIKTISSALTIPVIACGGAAKDSDFAEVYDKTDVSAVAAGNTFHFKEMSYVYAKQYLRKRNYNIR